MIKLLLLDVDGTLTNGNITLIEQESNIYEAKNFDIHDGLGIVTWLKMGREIAIISGRESKSVSARAKELGITRVFLGIGDKSNIAKNIISGLKLKKQEVACIGDDLNDLGMFKYAGLSFAPNNANEYIKQQVDVVLTRKGGEGAVREMIDFIVMRNDEEKKEFLSFYEKR